ncbi:autotransporter outer membrane beta-barrel domain-containing protein [Luteolibacter flavescens]|uniref:Autotransporter outer membrane beta-barrel domain-containing protein n=1 Tax=Luteolibacter flavescens TaxID=1859460 RepID=A0ABT3FUB3_9BACT|nr:autotransporter outer membrane beta-barrel domain-containing protein [Luteolibacter flavescens]MCW1887172.1 autotransporter outer membrane beta-barrel domain-containing protein [Luteolibacter flavescens]
MSYPFTSALQNTPVISGFDGGLVNSEYASYTPGSGTITTTQNGVDDWLIVTISGIGRGDHTVTADSGPGQLTEWTLDGGITDVGIIVGGGLDGPVTSSVASSTIGLTRSMTRDVGNRLFRMRTGIRPETPQAVAAPSYSAKGGAKGGSAKGTDIVTYKTCPWEVYGQIYYTHDDQDAQFTRTPGVVGGPNGGLLMLHPGTKSEIFGGNVGIDYEINKNWAVGFAVSAAKTDIDLGSVGDVDVDSWALIPYVSYYQPSVFGSADFYADLMYAYGDHDYDLSSGGVFGSTDGNTHQLEFTTGLNFRNGGLVHGPYGVVRWIDGEIDAHAFSGGFDTDLESVATQLGYQVSYPVSMGSGTLVPQARVAWEHEFEGDLGTVGGVTLGEVDEDIAVLGTGIGYYLSCGWNVVLDYEARLGSESQSHYVGLKAGYEF